MEDYIKKALEDSKEEIQSAVLAKVKEEIVSNYYWSLRENISKIVKDFFEEEMAEDIKGVLSENRELFMKEIQNGIADVAVELSKAMAKKAGENLAGYQGREVLNKLFG